MLGFFQTRSNSGAPAPGSPSVALTIAGHDPCGGAGITADLQVFSAHGLFGASAITALTVQSTLGVAAIEPVSGSLLQAALRHQRLDISPGGIKIGMLATAATVYIVAEFLDEQRLAPQIPIVLDPVLRSSSGAPLLDHEGLIALRDRLMPHVGWITPNWSELALLAQMEVTTASQVQAAADRLASLYPNLYLVVTGGDQAEPTDSLRLTDGSWHHFPGEHIASRSTHGTGCAFSSALLANLMAGATEPSAVQKAKDYVAQAIRQAPNLGHGNGPLRLLWPIQPAS